MEGKIMNPDQRRKIGTFVIVHGEALAFDGHTGPDLDMQRIEIDLAVKALAEFADNPVAGVLVDIFQTRQDENAEGNSEKQEQGREIEPRGKKSAANRHLSSGGPARLPGVHQRGKISECAGRAASGLSVMLIFASRESVTGGRQISLLQAW